MASSRKPSYTNTIHHNLKLRTSNRSEFNDSLLRHNQREENRLLMQLEQWDKVSGMAAKGMDKDAYVLKQKHSVSAAGSHAVHRPAKRNSLIENSHGVFDESGARLIPDYQYRGHGYGAALEQEPKTAVSERKGEGDEEKRSTSKPGKKSHQHREKDKEEKKSKSSKHSSQERFSDRKSSRQVLGPTQRHSDKDATLDGKSSRKKQEDIKSGTNINAEGSTKAEDSKTGLEDKSPLQSRSQEIPVATPMLYEKTDKKSDASVKENWSTVEGEARPSPSLNRATSDLASPSLNQESADPAAMMADSDSAAVKIPKRKTSSTITVPMLMPDWDGRRRYTNVWDSLSIPRASRASHVRAVRERLHQEFAQQNAARAGSQAADMTWGKVATKPSAKP